MIRKGFHIVLLFAALLLMGCTAEKEPLPGGGPGLELTVRCDNPLLVTKADPESTKNGELSYNENLINSVDFFFYPGANPATDANAVYHIRKEIENTNWEYTFNLIIKKDYISLIFSEENDFKATIYTLVNFDTSFFDNLPGTSLKDFAAARLTTDFAQTETNYIQPRFPMDGMKVVTYNENNYPNVLDEIEVKRFASKLTLAVHLADKAVLEHRSLDPNKEADPPETWKPVPHTMRLYLVDGVKTVCLSHDGSTLPDLGAIDSAPEYFSYRGAEHIRPFLNENGRSYVEDSPETVDNKEYYKTYPMYSYPREWNYNQWDYEHIDYTQGNPQEPPYFKLEMDWRREADKNYSYDRRKYYYKIILPFTKFVRNNWYGFYLDVSILGSETDEGQAILEPTCYLLDWQNKSVAINKVAVISKARFLSVDKKNWEINNQDELSIPFQSSHDVVIIPSSVHATRPYYGEITKEVGRRVGDYNEDLHATICGNENDGYYLDYSLQPEGEQYEKYKPYKWLRNTYTTIDLIHPLQNDYRETDFDYSPYTITFDINHRDLAETPTTTTYAQYIRSITIVQRPGIYIEATRNSDTEIKQMNASTYPNNPYGYSDGKAPWADKPWGYVYMNGGRFVRLHNKPKDNKEDPFYELCDDGKREYQWQTIWYTGGSKDIYNIHVTVLPESSDFIIGDPREDDVNNMADPAKYPPYSYEPKNEREREILEVIQEGDQYPISEEHPYGIRTGFNRADALYGDSPRALTWYYPTEKSSRTRDMVAPSYRIASKFGGTEYGGGFFGDLQQTYAEYRCAGYQEDGFPAGRWRLPTRAEIHFIAQLSAKGAFEFLFGSTVYWSAHGAIRVNQKDGTVTNDGAKTALLRCVYDSWYWDQVDFNEDKTVKGEPRLSTRNQFIWGDKER